MRLRVISSVQQHLNQKNMIKKLVPFGCIISLVIACNDKKAEPATTTTTVDKEAIKQEIQAKENQFAEVYNSGEFKQIGYYAEDAKTFYPNRKPLEGRDAIVSFLRSDLLDNTSKIKFTTNEVFVSSDGNMVVEIGAFKVMDSTMAEVLNTGNYMSLFEKRNGKYVSVRDMSASDQSPMQ